MKETSVYLFCSHSDNFNFLTQASWKLYQMVQHPTSLCTTSNFLMVAMVIIVTKVMKVMVSMVAVVNIVVMVVRTGQDRTG